MLKGINVILSTLMTDADPTGKLRPDRKILPSAECLKVIESCLTLCTLPLYSAV